MADRPKARVWPVTRQALAAAWEHLGTVMVGSSLWFLIGFTPLFFFMGVFFRTWSVWLSLPLLLVVIFTFGPATAGVHTLLEPLVWREENPIGTTIREYFKGFRRYYWKSVGLVGINGLLFVILVVDIGFFASQPGFLMRSLAVVWLYILLFQLVVANFYFPFLVRQKTTPLAAMKKSALFVLDNPGVSFAVALEVIVLFAVSVVVPVLLFIVFMGVAAFLQAFAFKTVMRRYED